MDFNVEKKNKWLFGKNSDIIISSKYISSPKNVSYLKLINTMLPVITVLDIEPYVMGSLKINFAVSGTNCVSYYVTTGNEIPTVNSVWNENPTTLPI